jgi:ribosomal protein L37E
VSTRVFKRCKECGKRTLHVHRRTLHMDHALICVVTLGLWLPAWLLLTLNNNSHGRCTRCGRAAWLWPLLPLRHALHEQ